mgnify:CR=1 FL=1
MKKVLFKADAIESMLFQKAIKKYGAWCIIVIIEMYSLYATGESDLSDSDLEIIGNKIGLHFTDIYKIALDTNFFVKHKTFFNTVVPTKKLSKYFQITDEVENGK